VRERLEHALGDPPVRSQDQTASPERLGRHPARRHVAIPLSESHQDFSFGSAAWNNVPLGIRDRHGTVHTLEAEDETVMKRR
jgi:hypothetical protein